MTAEAITKVTKMLEILPDNLQNQVVEHLRDYIADLQDEINIDEPQIWANEALRREQEVTKGLSSLVPGKEAVSRIRARLR